MPFQLGYRPRNIRKNQKAPTFVGAFVDLNLNLVVLWTDQSRRPSAIDAPSHHGFGLYRHFDSEYNTISESLFTENRMNMWNGDSQTAPEL